MFAICAVLARAATPSGYMLDVSEDGVVRVEVCGDTQSQAYLFFDPASGKLSKDAPEHTPEDSPESNQNNHCIFTGTTALIETQSATPAAANIFYSVFKHIRPSDVAFIYSTSPPLPARGPPFSF